MSEPRRHCFADQQDGQGDVVAVCMLPRDHDGPCRFSRLAQTHLVVFPEEMGAWQFEEDAIVVEEPPLDQAKRAAGDPELPGLRS